MKMIILERQKHTEPEFGELYAMLDGLKDFLNEDADIKSTQWRENFTQILDFQDSDGSFKLLDSFEIPSDARVDFCYMPTYISTAILMKACLASPESFTEREMSALSKGLEISCARNLRGHGYDALKGQIEAIKIFMKAGVREFLDLYPEICPEFKEMTEKIASKFKEMESQSRFTGPWGESYEDEIRAVNEYFSHRNVFVYGTLMKGETNHGYLENSTCLGPAFIEGYAMYNVGWYPAIVAGDGLVIGELYQVSKGDLPAIDTLEGEGSLYSKRCESVTDASGKSSFALVYVYLGDVSGLERIASWKGHVWYVSYGSNMLKDRFMCYIKGGSYEGGRYHPPCSDTTPPVAVRAVDIPHDMYFANQSGSWQGGGVSFLDVSERGHALGVAYLITEEQFEHVSLRENSGRAPEPGYGWYEDIIGLGVMDGFEVKTITNRDLRIPNEPCSDYWNTLVRGIKQSRPEMSDAEIEDYLKGCLR